jgi:hypothetical protein
MIRLRTTAIVLLTLAAVIGVATLAACRQRAPLGSRPIAAGALRGWNVLLVTIDTLRADHVGAYGSVVGATPTLDRLAREGLRFEVAYAHVPLTLPSHTTIMTGLYPFTSGVRDNGSFRFDGKRPTLAGTLKHAGYDTAAFVGAFPVDARFGLNAGFDVYDDNYGSRPVGGELSVLERPAEEVLAPAYAWLTNPKSRIPNPESRIPSPESRVAHPQSPIPCSCGSTSTIHTIRTSRRSRIDRGMPRTRIQAKSRTPTRRWGGSWNSCAGVRCSIARSSSCCRITVSRSESTASARMVFSLTSPRSACRS